MVNKWQNVGQDFVIISAPTHIETEVSILNCLILNRKFSWIKNWNRETIIFSIRFGRFNWICTPFL